MSSLVNSGKVFRRKFTKSPSVTMFCGTKDGPSFALFCFKEWVSVRLRLLDQNKYPRKHVFSIHLLLKQLLTR